MCSLLSNETLFKTQLELQRKEVELIQAKVQIMELQGLLKEKKGRNEGSTTTTASYFNFFIYRKHRKLVSYLIMSLLLLLYCF